MSAQYEVYAAKYAHADKLGKSSCFLLNDDHQTIVRMDFFVWVVRSAEKTIVFDMGFDESAARSRGKTWDRSPREALSVLGVDTNDVEDVVISHMHWDHAGNFQDYPNAKFHIQDAEMAFCTGRSMCHPSLRWPFEKDHVKEAVDKLFDGRLIFHNGDAEIADGISLHLVGGHSRGLQIMRVSTARGNLVLASDALHFWDNMLFQSPFPVFADHEKVAEGWQTCRALADSIDQIIPGHDPAVLRRFPAVKGVSGIVRVDLPPVAT